MLEGFITCDIGSCVLLVVVVLILVADTVDISYNGVEIDDGIGVPVITVEGDIAGLSERVTEGDRAGLSEGVTEGG